MNLNQQVGPDEQVLGFLQPTGVEIAPSHETVSYGPATAIYDALSPVETAPTEFPMHGIERAAVERLINRHGGVLRHVEVDERCGREWVGYRYFIRKALRSRGFFARIVGR